MNEHFLLMSIKDVLAFFFAHPIGHVFHSLKIQGLQGWILPEA